MNNRSINKTIVIILVSLIVFVISLSHYNSDNGDIWYYNNESNYYLDLNMIQHYSQINKRAQRQVIIAIIDAGIDTRCKVIRNKLWKNIDEIENGIDDDQNGYVDDIYGWNFIDNNPEVYDSDISHGTSIAGIITSEDNYCPGIASKINVRIMTLKVLNSDGETDSIDEITKAIQYAEDNGAGICNMSMSTDIYSHELENIIGSSKMLFVVSSGNGESRGKNIDKEPVYPASYNCENIISVGAADITGVLLSVSNYGYNSVDILAPGESIYVPLNDNRSGYRSGTSYAAAFVSGVAALYYCDKETTWREAKNTILKNAIENYKVCKFIKDGKLLSSNLN